jgi:hypothetical protein
MVGIWYPADLLTTYTHQPQLPRNIVTPCYGPFAGYRFQKFSTIYLSFNLILIIIIANLLLLSTVSTAAQLTAYSFLFLSVLCVSKSPY